MPYPFACIDCGTKALRTLQNGTCYWCGSTNLLREGEEMITLDDLEIIKTALEGDILRQKQSENVHHPAFKKWLIDTEKLHKKVANELITRKAKIKLLESMKF
jgi:hypothetical protein